MTNISKFCEITKISVMYVNHIVHITTLKIRKKIGILVTYSIAKKNEEVTTKKKNGLLVTYSIAKKNEEVTTKKTSLKRL